MPTAKDPLCVRLNIGLVITLEAHAAFLEFVDGLLDIVDARGQTSERYLLFQDADFEYQRVRVNLLRATGELEKWALQNPTK